MMDALMGKKIGTLLQINTKASLCVSDFGHKIKTPVDWISSFCWAFLVRFLRAIFSVLRLLGRF